MTFIKSTKNTFHSTTSSFLNSKERRCYSRGCFRICLSKQVMFYWLQIQLTLKELLCGLVNILRVVAIVYNILNVFLKIGVFMSHPNMFLQNSSLRNSYGPFLFIPLSVCFATSIASLSRTVLLQKEQMASNLHRFPFQAIKLPNHSIQPP